ncbi:MAG: M20/M25/M40 family metallo-hydrolase, partial [Steroidobacteraceae bacterium]
GARSVICVQHYDVVPAAPLDLWTTPPFEPAIRDGHLFARGSNDNKGMFLMRLHAVEAWRETFGELPCRVRFLVEGEEESGSNHLQQLLVQRPEFLQADAALNEAGYIDPRGRPMVTCGLRGILYVDLSVRTLAGDIHSEMAMLLPNAAERLLQALATLKRPDGRIAIGGFYDDALAATPEQIAHLRTLAFEEAALKRIHGAKTFVGGKSGFDAQAATMFEPTCNISGLASGWSGHGMKTVIPAEARAKLDMRLIPNQDPQRILDCLRRHFDAHGFDDIAITTLADESPWWTPVSHPLAQAAAAASEEMFDSAALRIISSMSTAPMHQVCSKYRLPAVGFGCLHPDNRAHAPDENISLALMTQGAKVFGRFLARFAQMRS